MHSLTELVARYLKGRDSMSTDPTQVPTPDVTAASAASVTESLSPESPATASTESPSLPPAEATPEQIADARDELKDAVEKFTAAVEGVATVGLDPLAELQTAGFNFGTELPPVDAGGPGDETATALGHVPPNQLPPV